MKKPVLGMVVGAVLGLLDGLSAWFSPEARAILIPIVLGSTLKGIVTGLAAGLIARWKHSVALGVGAGLAIGFVLSTLAAMGQPGHYAEIVLPGMLVGVLVGFVTQRYPGHIGARSASTGLVIAASLLAAPAVLGQSGAEEPVASLAPLVGRWTGTSEGQPGSGTVEREYERMFGARFVRVRNRSVYPPQEKNVKGETHQDEGIFSFDRTRKRVVFRQFHTEGFVNHYALDAGSTAKTLIFVSEAIENIPAGFRARETYTIVGPDAFEEVFELAEPGKPFEVYSRSRFTRVQ